MERGQKTKGKQKFLRCDATGECSEVSWTDMMTNGKVTKKLSERKAVEVFMCLEGGTTIGDD